MEAKGQSGLVAFDGQFVTITRTGLARATIGKGEKRIPVASLSAVQWKPAGGLVNGFIQFSLAGGVEGKSRAGSQTFNAAKDENSVVFTKKQQPQFDELRAAVEAAIADHHKPAASPTPAAVSVGDELDKLLRLRDAGALTDEEFQAQKAKLLGG